MLPADEIILWCDFRKGNEKALYQLYQLYYSEMLRYGWSFSDDPGLIRDYINRTMMDLWKKREQLPEVQHPKAYIITCFRNKLLYRKPDKGRLKLVPVEAEQFSEELSEASCEDTLVELQEFEELRLRIQQLMNGLSDRQKQILHLRFLEELSYEEISQKLDISVRTVYNSIHESIKQLKKQTAGRKFRAQ